MSSSDVADPKAPAPWVDGWRWDGVQFVRVDPQDAIMSLDTLREIASLAGLALATEADRKVLEACALVEHAQGEESNPLDFSDDDLDRIGEAELEARKTREK